jgi:hypothetical protein
MSAYKTIETQFRSLDSLLAALGDLGYTKEQIQVASKTKESTLPMYGYHGDLRPEKCGVRIARQHIGPASNDVGFAWDGQTWRAIISEFDMHASYKTSMNVERQAKLKQRYALHETKRIAKVKGYSIQETTMPDGTLRLTLNHR